MYDKGRNKTDIKKESEDGQLRRGGDIFGFCVLGFHISEVGWCDLLRQYRMKGMVCICLTQIAGG